MNLQNCSPLDEPFTTAKSNQNRAVLALCRFGCMAVTLIATLSVQAQDIYMRIGGPATTMGSIQSTPTLAGESTDAQYPNWITVLSMSHGVSRAVTSGGGAATPNHSDVSLMKLLDKATPSINLLVNGVTATVSQPIDYVTIDFRKTGTSEVYYRIELQNVSVTSAQISGSDGGGTPSESVSLFYTKIRWSYVKYLNGKAQTQVTTGWDVAAGKAF